MAHEQEQHSFRPIETTPGSLPFNFGQKPANPMDGYERLRHARAYVTHCARQRGLYLRKATDKRVLYQGMEALNMRNMAKFQRQRARWNECEGPIPLSYLRFIGVDLDLLQQAVGLDAKEWEEALGHAPSPRYFALRYLPGVYGQKDLPEGLTEEEAVAAVQAFQEANLHVHGCSIHWPGLKSVYIDVGRSPRYVYYRPGITVERGFLVFACDGSLAGTMRIG